jgi:tetratricopeptide (TPR) repeat protein
MGKNKKNRSQNFVNVNVNVNDNDNSDDDDFIDTPKKKNVFAQLEEFSDDINDVINDVNNNVNNNVNNDDISDNPQIRFDVRPDEYFAKGYHAEDYNNDYESAIVFYKMSLENDSDEFRGVAANNMAIIYEEQKGDLIKAEFYYKLSCDNKYEDAFAYLGLLYYKQEKYTEAEKYFEQSIKFGNINNYYEYAYCLEKNGDKQTALTYLEKHLMLKNANYKEKNIYSRLMRQ